MGRETNVSSREIDDLHILLNLKSNLKNYGNHLVGIIQGSIIWDNGGFESNI
jgi:chitinase